VRLGGGFFVVMSASFSSSWALRNDNDMWFSNLCSDLEGGSACAGEAKSSKGIEKAWSMLYKDQGEELSWHRWRRDCG
jgi:hypothetical protein